MAATEDHAMQSESRTPKALYSAADMVLWAMSLSIIAVTFLAIS
jgi:hypothetical protein